MSSIVLKTEKTCSKHKIAAYVADEATEVLRYEYQKPMLISYGDVRDVTLGGSPGGGDSGTPTTRRRR